MIKNYLRKLKNWQFLVALLFAQLPVALSQPTVLNYSFTGGVQSFTVPSCVSIITITAKGAQGGTNAIATVTGGLGGLATGVLTVSPGDVLNIYVGGTNGYNGGGAAGICSGCANAGGGIGGGASDVRLNGVALANRVIVAGGGGGAGGDRIPACGRGAGGGGGGGYYGGGGGSGWPGATAGSLSGGGSQTSGGVGGISTFNTINNGSAGALGIGGAGGGEVGSSQGTPQHNSFVGGAGGGLTGGNGIHTFAASFWAGMGGGGGSSYVGGLSGASTTSNTNAGNGSITLTYDLGLMVNLTVTNSTLICNGSTVNIGYPGAATYTWSNGSNGSNITVAPTTNTVYTVTGNLSACTYTGIATISVSPGTPTLSVVSSTNSTCFGKTATLTASGAITYTWSNNVTNGVSFTPSVTTTYTVQGQNGCGTTTAVTTISVAPLPVNIIVTPTVVCAASSATISTASSATTYSWFPLNSVNNTGSLVVSPAVPTTYTVAATDGTCSGMAVIALAVNPVPTINATASSTNVCQGDPVVLNASGGLNYTWTPGNLSGATVTVNPTAPTAYSVGADNQFGCYSGASAVIITNPSPVITTQASSNFICAGESVTISASGASSYLWSNPSASTATLIIENPSTSTVYSVTGTMNGCSSTETVQVDVFVNNVSVSGNTAVCEGIATTLTGSGASTYTWEPGTVPFNAITVTPTVNTTYTLSTHTSTGNLVCPGTTTIEVTIKPNPNVTAAPDRSIMCKSESSTLTASGANTYVWAPSGTTGSSVVVTSSLVTVLNYTVTGTGANGCTKSKSIQVTVNSCNGLSEVAGRAAIRVYPNPSHGQVTIESDEEMQITLVNQLGQVVDVMSLNAANSYKKDVSELAKGIYFVNGVSAGDKVTFKLIVE